MRLELTGRHVDITPALRRLVERKLAKLERLLDHRALSAQVVLTQGRRQPRVDVTLHARGERFLHGAAEADTFEPALTAVVEKLTQQAQKVKGKWQARKRERQPTLEQAPPTAAPPTSRTTGRSRVRMPRTFRSTRQAIETLSVADAAARVDGGRLDLLIFRDSETAALHVLYRSPGGELVLVQTES
jgi:putative sigma-54 modulation protein